MTQTRGVYHNATFGNGTFLNDSEVITEFGFHNITYQTLGRLGA